jgi:hypothetical protein
MKTIAYICSQVTISGSPNRRKDAFEHDRTLDVLRPAFLDRELDIVEVCWDDEQADWSEFAGAIIGTTWDYWDRASLFLDTLERIESQTRLFNCASTVRWNSHKGYLRDLATDGAKLIPTIWIEAPSADAIGEAFDVLDCDDMVVKRQVGAGATGQFRLKRGDAIPEMPFPMMAQPFFPSIQTEGEMSLIFIDGKFSHALIKKAKEGDYRIQSNYGGYEEAIEPSSDDLLAAEKVVGSVSPMPLYARVDMLRSESDELYLMELELIEPYLFPVEGPELGTRMAEAVSRRLGGGD